MKEEQGKKTSPVISDAAVKKVIPAKSVGELSEQDLAGVAGGVQLNTTRSNIKHGVAAPDATSAMQEVTTTR